MPIFVHYLNQNICYTALEKR